MIKVFYHSGDLDGQCSGAIVKKKLPRAELVGINYGQEFPWNSISEDDTVYMVDFSLQPYEHMLRLAKSCRLVWIDHHITSIKDYGQHDLPGAMRVNLQEKLAACESTWLMLFGEPIPMAVELLGRYDVWDHSNPDVLPFQYGMQLEDTMPENQGFWNNVFNFVPTVGRILASGRIALRYVGRENEKYAKACAFEMEFEELRFIAENRMLSNSQQFDAVYDPERHDAMLTFGWRDGKWVISMYATKPEIDLSIIAKKYGGGGHRGACGFECAELPFSLK